MQFRKDPLISGQFYHVFSRSISGYVIFNNDSEFLRMFNLLNLYRYEDFTYRYSAFIDLTANVQAGLIAGLKENSELIVEVVAFCIMPTHIHLVLKQKQDGGISKYMARILNGYSRYFNTRHGRNGPLWAGRFKSVLVENDEQLLHLTRYIHLNPSSAALVKNPEEWHFSSLPQYLEKDVETCICNKDGLFDMTAKSYNKFIQDRKFYQRDLSIIKSQLIDEYAG